MASRARNGGADSLADDLRARSDDELAALLRRRPDLARPPASDIATLAARATAPPSVARAVDALDRGRLHGLQALTVADGDLSDAAALCGAGAVEFAAVADDLRALGLVWRQGGRYRVPAAVAAALGPFVGGLAPATAGDTEPAPAREQGQEQEPDDGLRELVERVSPEARRLLDSLTWGPPVGDLPLDVSPALSAAVERLVATGLLERLTARRVQLPREVALVLRGGRIAPGDPLRPESPVLTPVPARATGAALAAVNGLIEGVDELGHLLGIDPPRMLRTGNLGVRELRRLRSELDLAPDDAVLLLELCYAAGLIGIAEIGVARDSDEFVYAPTPAFDAWRHTAPGVRWARLVLAWFGTDRAPSLITHGSAASAAQSPAQPRPAVFGETASSATLRTVRASTLDALAGIAGTLGREAVSAEDLTALVEWRHPRRDPRVLAEGVAAALREAEHLGVVAGGALTPAGAALWALWRRESPELDDPGALDDLEALAELEAALPPPAQELLLQGDLTAVVPGRVEGRIADFLRSVADLESRGGAAVFRFTPESVRRHLDTGATAEEVLTTLERHGSTGVPQPLDYLVRDVARRHGRIRVGEMSTFLRSDDVAALDAVEHDTAIQGLGLRRLAPTVLTATADRRSVVAVLGRAGHAPVVESLGGLASVRGRLVRAEAHPAGRGARATAPPPLTSDADIARIVEAMRAGDAASAPAAGSGPRISATDPAITLDVLREAVAGGSSVWIGVATAGGATSRLLFRPTAVEAGRVRGTVEGSDEPRTFSVHRLVGAIPATRGDPDSRA